MEFGKILKEKRETQNLDIKQISRELKIKAEYLQAFENEDFEAMPNEPYCLGFLKNYANFLNLEANKVLELYNESRKVFYSEDIDEDADVCDQNSENKFGESSKQIFRKIATNRLLFFYILSGLLSVFIVLYSWIFCAKIKNFCENFAHNEIQKTNFIELQNNLEPAYILEINLKKACWLKIEIDGKIVLQETVKDQNVLKFLVNRDLKVVVGDFNNVTAKFNNKPLKIFQVSTAKNVGYVAVNSEKIKDFQ